MKLANYGQLSILYAEQERPYFLPVELILQKYTIFETKIDEITV